MNRHNRRAAKARGASTPTAAKLSKEDLAFTRAIVALGKVMEQWLGVNPETVLEWHVLWKPPGGVATSAPEGLEMLAKSPDARRMLLESDKAFAHFTGNVSTVYMARTALALVGQMPHIDGN